MYIHLHILCSNDLIQTNTNTVYEVKCGMEFKLNSKSIILIAIAVYAAIAVLAGIIFYLTHATH